MLICCSTNISDYYQCWKQLFCWIFLWKLWYILFFRILWCTENSKELLFEIEIFCNLTFDQFNASFLKKKALISSPLNGYLLQYKQKSKISAELISPIMPPSTILQVRGSDLRSVASVRGSGEPDTALCERLQRLSWPLRHKAPNKPGGRKKETNLIDSEGKCAL